MAQSAKERVQDRGEAVGKRSAVGASIGCLQCDSMAADLRDNAGESDTRCPMHTLIRARGVGSALMHDPQSAGPAEQGAHLAAGSAVDRGVGWLPGAQQ